MWALASIFVASQSILSKKKLFCAIFYICIRKRKFLIATTLKRDILKIVQLKIWSYFIAARL